MHVVGEVGEMAPVPRQRGTAVRVTKSQHARSEVELSIIAAGMASVCSVMSERRAAARTDQSGVPPRTT